MSSGGQRMHRLRRRSSRRVVADNTSMVLAVKDIVEEDDIEGGCAV